MSSNGSNYGGYNNSYDSGRIYNFPTNGNMPPASSSQNPNGAFPQQQQDATRFHQPGTMPTYPSNGQAPGAAPNGMNYQAPRRDPQSLLPPNSYPPFSNVTPASTQAPTVDLTLDDDEPTNNFSGGGTGGGAMNGNQYSEMGQYALNGSAGQRPKTTLNGRQPDSNAAPASRRANSPTSTPAQPPPAKPTKLGAFGQLARAAGSGCNGPNPQLAGGLGGQARAMPSALPAHLASDATVGSVVKPTAQRSGKQGKAGPSAAQIKAAEKKAAEKQRKQEEKERKQEEKERKQEEKARAAAEKKQKGAAARQRMSTKAAGAAQAAASGNFDDQQKAFDASSSGAHGLSSPKARAPPAPVPRSLMKSNLALPGKPFVIQEEQPKKKPERQKKQQPETGDLTQLKEAHEQGYASRKASTAPKAKKPVATPAVESEEDDNDDEEDSNLFHTPLSNTHFSTVQIAQPKTRRVLSSKDIAVARGGIDMPPFGSLPGEEDSLDENDDLFGDGQAELDEERLQEEDMDKAGDCEDKFEKVNEDMKSTVGRIEYLGQKEAWFDHIGVPQDQRYGTNLAMPKYGLESLAEVTEKVKAFGDQKLREAGLDHLVGRFNFTAKTFYDADKLLRVIPYERTVLADNSVTKHYFGDDKVNLMAEQLHFAPGTMSAAVRYDVDGQVDLAVTGKLDGSRYLDVDVFEDERPDQEIDEEFEEGDGAEPDEAEDGNPLDGDIDSENENAGADESQLPTPDTSPDATSSPEGLSEKAASKKRKRGNDGDDTSRSKKPKAAHNLGDEDDGESAAKRAVISKLFPKKGEEKKKMNNEEYDIAFELLNEKRAQHEEVTAKALERQLEEALADGSDEQSYGPVQPILTPKEDADPESNSNQPPSKKTGTGKPAAAVPAGEVVLKKPSSTGRSVVGSGNTSRPTVSAQQPRSGTAQKQQHTASNAASADRRGDLAGDNQLLASAEATHSSATGNSKPRRAEEPTPETSAAASRLQDAVAANANTSSTDGGLMLMDEEEWKLHNAVAEGTSLPDDDLDADLCAELFGDEPDSETLTNAAGSQPAASPTSMPAMAEGTPSPDDDLDADLCAELFGDEPDSETLTNAADSPPAASPTSMPAMAAGAANKRKRSTVEDADDEGSSQPASKQPKMVTPAAPSDGGNQSGKSKPGSRSYLNKTIGKARR